MHPFLPLNVVNPFIARNIGMDYKSNRINIFTLLPHETYSTTYETTSSASQKIILGTQFFYAVPLRLSTPVSNTSPSPSLISLHQAIIRKGRKRSGVVNPEWLKRYALIVSSRDIRTSKILSVFYAV